MSLKKRIAEHFDVAETDVRYGEGIDRKTKRHKRGWFVGDIFLATSFYELQCSPAWTTKKL